MKLINQSNLVRTTNQFLQRRTQLYVQLQSTINNKNEEQVGISKLKSHRSNSGMVHVCTLAVNRQKLSLTHREENMCKLQELCNQTQ